MTSRFEESYTWDTADNLLKLKHTVGQSSWTRRFGMGGQSPDQWDTLLPQHSGDTQWPGAPSNAPTHTWDSGRRATGAVQRAPCNGQTSATHTYDAAGQLTAEGTSRHFEWDQAGRLKVYRTQVTGSEPSIYAIYLYDSAGQRLKKWVRRQGGSRIDTTVYIGGIFERHECVDGGVTTVNNTLHIIDGAQRIGTERVGPAFPEDSSPAIQYHLTEPHGTSNLVLQGMPTSQAWHAQRRQPCPPPSPTTPLQLPPPQTHPPSTPLRSLAHSGLLLQALGALEYRKPIRGICVHTSPS